MCYEGCEINGFRFYTKAYEQHRPMANNRVCMKGECINEKQYDYYGVLKEVIELEYDGVSNKVLFFKCCWFDITNGIKVDHQHDLIEVKHTFTLRTNESFLKKLNWFLNFYLHLEVLVFGNKNKLIRPSINYFCNNNKKVVYIRV